MYNNPTALYAIRRCSGFIIKYKINITKGIPTIHPMKSKESKKENKLTMLLNILENNVKYVKNRNILMLIKPILNCICTESI